MEAAPPSAPLDDSAAGKDDDRAAGKDDDRTRALSILRQKRAERAELAGRLKQTGDELGFFLQFHNGGAQHKAREIDVPGLLPPDRRLVVVQSQHLSIGGIVWPSSLCLAASLVAACRDPKGTLARFFSAERAMHRTRGSRSW